MNSNPERFRKLREVIIEENAKLNGEHEQQRTYKKRDTTGDGSHLMLSLIARERQQILLVK